MVAVAPSNATLCCTGAELLRWRRGLLAQGGNAADLDWLLEMQAGLIWQELQRMPLRPETPATLNGHTQEAEDLWGEHRLHPTPAD